MTTMFNPPHPGETLREDVLPALGLTVTQAPSPLRWQRALRIGWAQRTQAVRKLGSHNRPLTICGKSVRLGFPSRAKPCGRAAIQTDQTKKPPKLSNGRSGWNVKGPNLQAQKN